MEKVKAWALAHRRIIGGVVLVVLLVVIAVLLFRSCKTEQPQKVTVEPQTQAQTEAGVEKAADAAQVPVNAANGAQHLQQRHLQDVSLGGTDRRRDRRRGGLGAELYRQVADTGDLRIP